MSILPPRGFLAAVAAAVILSSIPAFAGDLPAVEHGWRTESARLKAAFTNDGAIHFADDGQIVDFIWSRALDEDIIPDSAGRLQAKKTLIGDLWIDGLLVGRDRVVSTTYGPHTWTTIHGPHGMTTLFPDGRAMYAESTPLPCGADAPAKGELLVGEADAAGRPRPGGPPQPVEIVDTVFYTPRAETFWGVGTAQAHLLNVQDDHNLNLATSGLGHITFRFVGFHRDAVYDDSETPSPTNGLKFFTYRNKRYKTIWKQDHADLMTLFAFDMPHDRPTRYAGLGMVKGPNKLVKVAYVRDNDIYTHEAGHNLGLRHALAYVNCADTSPDQVDNFTTVMFSAGTGSEAPPPVPPGCTPTHITLYSNKNAQYRSPWTGKLYPLGDLDHNEAAILILNAPVMAQWGK